MNKFDEALNKITEYENSDSALYIGSGAAISTSSMKIIIEDLSQEYAPTVEMTQEQHQLFITCRNNAVNRVDKVGLMEFMSAYGMLDLKIDHISLMRSWLDPNVIKVVEEEQ